MTNHRRSQRSPNLVASWDVTQGSRLGTVPDVGTKTRGLLSLPHSWTPSFVALTYDGARRAAARQPFDKSHLVAIVELAAGRRLVVRSDGPMERMRPGEGISITCQPAVADLVAAIERVVSHATPDRPGALVQVAVEPALVGMMSNERRFTPTPDNWIVEGELGLRGPEVRRLTAVPGANTDLTAANEDQALKALATVASAVLLEGARRRVEWLWDGERIWVVQADVLPEPANLAERPGRSLRHVRPHAGLLHGAAEFQGRKLGRWRTFERLGWPRPDVCVILPGELSGAGASALTDRLGHLGAGPTVVRTDTSEGSDAADLLLPTSAPAEQAGPLVEFMADTVERMKGAGVDEREIAFLAAPLVQCEVSAWVHAKSGCPRVRVDALWGYPDGLLHLPHDSFVVTSSGETSAAVRFKPACVLPEVNGWAVQAVPAPFDWQPTLEDKELRGLAALGIELADHVRGEVQLMVLARVDGVRGPDGLLPFHFTRLSTAAALSDAHVGLPGKERDASVVATPADLETLDDNHPPAALRVAPSPRHLRDVPFLKRVGRWASQHRVPVLFEGSLLGHAFHLLASEGAVVAQPTFAPKPDHASEWRAVVVSRVHGLDRVQALPVAHVEHMAVRTIARMLPFASEDPVARLVVERALRVFTSTGSPPPGPRRFEGLAAVHEDIQDSPAPGAAGIIPLFMDEASDETTRAAPSVDAEVSLTLPQESRPMSLLERQFDLHEGKLALAIEPSGRATIRSILSSGKEAPT